MDSHSLEIYPTRFGYMVRPVLPTVGFDYNRVYFSIDDVLKDFYFHGWEVTDISGNIEPFSGSVYKFRRREVYEPVF